jgi:hypothetical protein
VSHGGIRSSSAEEEGVGTRPSEESIKSIVAIFTKARLSGEGLFHSTTCRLMKSDGSHRERLKA